MSSVCKKSVSFYSDAPEWGGQEILSARIASIVAETCDVTFFYSCDKFAENLPASVKRIKLLWGFFPPRVFRIICVR